MHAKSRVKVNHLNQGGAFGLQGPMALGGGTAPLTASTRASGTTFTFDGFR